jgi:WhiB family redox-sensing transcriptional regulator
MTRNAVAIKGTAAEMAVTGGALADVTSGAGGHWEDWRELAACRHTEPELFFPAFSGDRSQSQVECARAICAVCPVRRECLRFALGTRQSYGVWGGIELTTIS